MRHQRAIVQYFDDPAPNREALRDKLKQELATHQFYLEKWLLFSDYSRFEQRLQRSLTVSRMTDLGLQIELFRLNHGHLPESLDELGVKLPVDALSGEPIRYIKGKVKVWVREDLKTVSHELPGWQLSAPGSNFGRTSDQQEEHMRDTFTVITQWPVPPAPEPPETDDDQSDFFIEP